MSEADFNKSSREPRQEYYTKELADQVYRTYQRDFDQLRHPRAI